jgi:phage-related minor tail protein
MAKDTTSTLKYKADIADLKAGFQQAKTAIAGAKAEFDQSTKSLDNWRESSEGVEAKLKQLNKTLDAQKNQLDNYRDQLTKTEEQYGENSIQAEQLREKIEKQKSAIAKTSSEIKKYEGVLDDVTKAEQMVADEGGNVHDRLKEIRGSAKDAGDATEDAGDGFTILKGTLADLASSAIQSVIGGLADLASQLWELPEATKEFRTVFSATMQSAEDSVIGIEGATKAYEEFYRISADEGQSAEATSHISNLVNSQGQLQDALDGVIGAWIEFGDSISIEGLAEASNETAKTGIVTGQFADALNWASDSGADFKDALSGNKDALKAFNSATEQGMSAEDAFNEALKACSSEQERQQLVVSTLNSLYSDNAKAYEESNGSLLDANSANLNLLKSQSELATAIEPVTALWTNMKASALDAITPAIEWLSNKFQDLTKYLSEHQGVATVLTAVVAGLAGGFTILAGALAIQTLISGVTKAIGLLNLTMYANPAVWVVAGIMALVAVFVVLWNKCDGFRKFWVNLWDNIKTVASNAWQGIKTFFSSIPTFFKEKFTGAYNNIKSVFNKLPSFFKGLWNKIKSTFSSLGTKIGNAISGAVKTAINGVLRLIENRINSAIGLINGAIGLINKLPGVSVGKVSKVSLPRLATGGVVDEATLAMIGENGKEAIVPLEKNLGWIKGIAKELSKEIGTNNVVMNSGGVSGGVVNNFYQTNNSPRSLSRIEIYRQSKNLLAMRGV